MHFTTTLVSLLALVSQAAASSAASFDINAKDNLVLYWGQASAGFQQTLGDYCEQSAGDVYVLSFMNDFTSDSFGLNFAGNCDSTSSCPQIGQDIQKCQSLGKVVLLSLGGAIGSYGFTSDSDADDFAKLLWNNFAGGSSSSRPFGDAIVDGFDLDIENNSPTGYASLVNSLRTYYKSGSKPYYVSAAPQCVYPDANVGDALANSDIDMAFIQFYNNYCSLDQQFNWDTWQTFAESTSPNKNIKLFIGLPGASAAAGSGYVSPSVVQSAVNTVSTSSNFGGIMLWDASQGFSNQVNGQSFAQDMQDILNGISGGSSGSNSGSGSGSATVTSNSVSEATSSAPEATSSAASPVTSSSEAPAASTNVFLLASQPATTADVTTSTPAPSSSAADVATSTPEPSSSTADVASSTPTPSSTAADAASSSSASSDETCTTGQTRCTDGKYNQCAFGTWVVFDCAPGTECIVMDGTPVCGFPPSKRDYMPPVVKRHSHMY